MQRSHKYKVLLNLKHWWDCIYLKYRHHKMTGCNIQMAGPSVFCFFHKGKMCSNIQLYLKPYGAAEVAHYKTLLVNTNLHCDIISFQIQNSKFQIQINVGVHVSGYPNIPLHIICVSNICQNSHNMILRAIFYYSYYNLKDEEFSWSVEPILSFNISHFFFILRLLCV